MKLLKKKTITCLLAVLALCAVLCCAAAAEGPEPAFRAVWYPGPSLGFGPAEIQALVLADHPAGLPDADGLAAEIRFLPFDSSAGLYACGEGEPAGSRAKVTADPDFPCRFYIRLSEPGKYVISGTGYYLLDPENPALAAIRDELDSTVEKSLKKNEKDTAKALHDWLCGRVKSVFPEEAGSLSAFCSDPMNALLSGYANRDAYAPLYKMLLGAAGIRAFTVSGTAGEDAADWNLCRLDGNWVYTDAAADDLKDKKQNRYFALAEDKLAKDHALREADRAFADSMIRSAAVDALAEGTLTGSMLKVYGRDSQNFSLLRSNDPCVQVGESMTVTLHLLSNQAEKYRQMSPEEFLESSLSYFPWIEEEMGYSDDFRYPGFEDPGCSVPRAEKLDLFPPVSELCTVESAAEDLSTLTVTFHRPGFYRFFSNVYSCFYLISPEQAELVSLAEEIRGAAAEAKAAPTEKAAARKLMSWLLQKVKYNYPMANCGKITFRDWLTAREGLGAMLYGKAVCVGYADAYDILLRMAGLEDYRVDGNVRTGGGCGHTWNLNRLDRAWSCTDPTWKRFDQTKKQMDSDHELWNDDTLSSLFFRSAFDLLADQFREDCLASGCLPKALKSLPLSAAEGYGFEKYAQTLIDVTELAPAQDGGTAVSLSKAAIVQASQLEGGERLWKTRTSSEKPAAKLTAPNVQADKPLRIEIGSSPSLDEITKPCVYECLDYENGLPAGGEYRYYEPTKDYAKEYPERAVRFLVWGPDKKPAAAGWHLVAGYHHTLDLKIFFDENGNAEYYSAALESGLTGIKTSWKATAAGILTEYNGEPVSDPEAIRQGLWSPIVFTSGTSAP